MNHDEAAMMSRSDPSAFGHEGDEPGESLRIERERMPDGRLILYYSWPNDPPIDAVEAGAGATGQEPAQGGPPKSEPWSPETQPEIADEERVPERRTRAWPDGHR